MPKYHWGKVERIGGEFLRVLKREFECRGTKYKIEVAPAVITDRDGVKSVIITRRSARSL